jgi:hypothetical protein
MMLPFGFEDEIRVFAIAWPPMVVLVAAALDSLYEDRTRAAEA